MIRNTDQLASEVRALQLQFSGQARAIAGLRSDLDTTEKSVRSLLITRAETPAAPVANLLWNGELGHSVHTWHRTADPPTSQENEECAWFFSHTKPHSTLTFTTISTNDQIPITGHGLTSGDAIQLTTTGTLPTGLATSTTYYVHVINSNVIGLATTPQRAIDGSVLVSITAATGSGTHTLTQLLVATDARTTAGNLTLKTSAHSQYRPHFAKWDAVNGWAELTRTNSLDVILPANLIDATTSLARVGMIAAKRNIYIDIPSSSRLSAGIWDNTTGQRKFLEGSIAFTAELSGTAGATTRKFRLYITSDRGYSLLSDEVTISNAPADGAFSSTSNIVMSWPQQAGQLQAEIYELVGGQYRLLTQISGATSYIHQGSFLSVVGGYPTPSGTTLSATLATRTGELSGIATNGVSGSWDTVAFPLAVPANYNKGNTTDRQWLRIWMTEAADLLVTGVTTNGTTTVSAPASSGSIPVAFEAEYDDLYPGLTALVYDSAGTLIATTTVSSRSNDTDLVLNASIAAGSNRIVRLVGGGFHGLLIDKIHLGYHPNTTYAPNPNDVRTLQPRAAPTSSTQGGVGTGDGGSGDGGVVCVAEGTPIKMQIGYWSPVQTTRAGQLWASGGVRPNLLVNLKEGVSDVRTVVSENGCEITCTDTERFITSETDMKGTPLCFLRVGDLVMTEVDDRLELSRIKSISGYKGVTKVYTPTLSDGHLFVAGQWKCPSLLQRVLMKFARRGKVQGGFILHNAKIDPLDGGGIFV